MSLINSTYFIGDLTIAGLTRPEVSERLAVFISKYEDEFLRSVLGYPLYKSFLAGLSEDPVNQMWLDILEGKEYEYSGRARQWRGLIMLPPGQTLSINPAGQEFLRPGGSGEFDPVVGAVTLTIPPAYVGRYFSVERRGTGELRPDEFEVSGNTLTLIGMPPWNSEETVILSKNPSIGISGAGDDLKSPIANYVYWHWMKDNTTQTVGLGEVSSKAENAAVVSPSTKMVRAWNEMSECITELYRFLDTNYSVYTDWNSGADVWRRDFRPTNVFGI